MKIAIIINEKRLTPELKAKLDSKELSEKYNIAYDVFSPSPDELEKVLEDIKSQSYNAYLIGGGDGTVRTAIQVLCDSNAVICILSLGTFNLLAKTLQYPTDIEDLFALIKNNKTKQIDLIKVNDVVLVNHAWIGIYYYIIKERKKHQSIIGKNKLLKILFNTVNFFKVLPIYTLELKVDGNITCYQTCLVYIGNNEYGENLLELTERKTLSSGLMSVTILNCQSRWQLFKCTLSFLFGRAKDSPYITQFNTEEMTITAKSNLINIVLDGDLFKLNSPLHFSSHQKKITVLVP